MAGVSWRAFPSAFLATSNAVVVAVHGFESRHLHQLIFTTGKIGVLELPSTNEKITQRSNKEATLKRI